MPETTVRIADGSECVIISGTVFCGKPGSTRFGEGTAVRASVIPMSGTALVSSGGERAVWTAKPDVLTHDAS